MGASCPVIHCRNTRTRMSGITRVAPISTPKPAISKILRPSCTSSADALAANGNVKALQSGEKPVAVSQGPAMRKLVRSAKVRTAKTVANTCSPVAAATIAKSAAGARCIANSGRNDGGNVARLSCLADSTQIATATGTIATKCPRASPVMSSAAAGVAATIKPTNVTCQAGVGCRPSGCPPRRM